MNMDILNAALAAVRNRFSGARPLGVVILGSGWGVSVDAFTVRKAIDFASVPGMGAPTVSGHAGRLLWADCGGAECLIADGRRHAYEGLGWEPVAIPVFLAKQLGATFLILTNAAGGIRRDLSPGSIMIIDDHINLMGAHPLAGPQDALWGPRFPDMTAVYDEPLRKHFDETARRRDIPVHHGVYAAMSGPSYETPAEVRALAGLGAEAVGMSTVPEAILAHAAGLRVGALSLITNAAAGVAGATLDHAEVLDQARARERTLQDFLTAVLSTLPTLTSGAES